VSAFTLVEMLAVIALMLVMTALVVPAFTGVKSAGDVTKAVYDIAGILDQARAYAMSNNTYVFVGFAEVDASVHASAVPQVATGNSPYGRVVVAVVASKDGKRGYDVSRPENWKTNYSSGPSPIVKNLMAINKLQRFENLHLADLGATPPATGAMARPAVSNATTPSYNVANAGCVSTTPFTWPLGSSLSGDYQYAFVKVIYFDPQGVARIQSASNADTIPRCAEIGLQPSRGNVPPPLPSDQNVGNQAAIQIDGMTGATRIYRP